MIEAVAKCLKKLSFSKAVCGAAGLLSKGLRVTGQRQLVSKGDLQLFTEAVEGEGLGVGLTGAEGGLGGGQDPGPAPSPPLSPSDRGDLGGKRSENPWHRRLIGAYVGSTGS